MFLLIHFQTISRLWLKLRIIQELKSRSCTSKAFARPKIFRLLKTVGLAVSLASIIRIIKKLKTTGSVANLPHSGRPTKISDEAKQFIDLQMRKDDEMTSRRINYNTRFTAKQSYYLPFVRTNYGKFNIRFQGPSIWNSIDYDIKLSSISMFKKKLQVQYFERY